MKQLSFLLLIFTSFNTWAGYTMSDLEVLAQDESFEEFFNHVLDVRPSDRKDAWKGLVSKMADGYSRSLLTQSEIKENQFKKIEELFSWPNLKHDDVFKLRRQDIGMAYLKKCLKASTPCWDEAKSFWEADQQNAELAMKLAELIQSYPDSALKIWALIDVAVKNPLSEFYCKKDFVLKELWQKLGIDYIRLGPQGDFLKKIDETVHPDCLPSLNKYAQEKFLRPDKVDDRELAFQMLKAQDKTDRPTTDFFMTVYLLERPSRGELFNYAWNRLMEMSKSIVRREEVLKRINMLDPLPDDLFSSSDAVKKRAILNHFKGHFPEYLDAYTNQCLSFYEGTKVFKNGNPTIHCQDLMKSENAASLLPSDIIQRFQKAKKI